LFFWLHPQIKDIWKYMCVGAIPWKMCVIYCFILFFDEILIAWRESYHCWF